MASGSLFESLRSGVGRRILGMFMLAALLPVIFTAFLSYGEVHRGLKQEVAKDLKEDAKSYGVEILARLTRAADKAQVLSGMIRDGNDDLEEHGYLLQGFEAVWQQKGSLITNKIKGPVDSPVPFKLLKPDHLRSGRSQLISHSSNGHEALIFATPVISPATGQISDIVMLRLDSRRIWGPRDNLPYMTQFCVFGASPAALFCTDEMTVDSGSAAALMDESNNKAMLEYPTEAESYFIASWQLFLDGIFSAAPMVVVAGQPESYALRSSADFRRIYPPALALVIILVGVFSLHLIGKSLVPLNRLKLLARQFAGGELKSRIRLRTGDEFQALGETFNHMAGQLDMQIDTLKAMSDIDRLILAGVEIEEVGEKVINSLINLVRCDAAGIIARDSDSPAWAKMITYHDEEFSHERISLPQGAGHEWCQPREVEIGLVDDSVAPYKARFQAYGQKYVVVIPVVLEDVLKGVLLLGSTKPFDVKQASMQRCVDLAGRLAVALASAEREEALYRQAHFDDLTGLPNRQLLKDRLHQQIVQARRDERSGALLFLDLDRFKEINDVFGHSTGDSVLAQAAERIVAEVRDTDTVARLGGDEFVVVLPSVHDDTTVQSLASRLLERLSEVFVVRENEHFVSASIGVAMFPEDGDSVETILKNADAAMYRAKDAGRSRFEFCSEKLNAESRRKVELERDLREAFYKGSLEVYYQPQFDLSSGVICGAEALLRWPHPVKGFVSPAEFVPLAEDSGLINEIGRWVLAMTCENLKSILDVGLHPGPVSINVSGLQLRDTQFIDDVLMPLRKHDIHPGFIQLEITETAVAQNRDIAIHVLKELRNEGVRVAIDDFGTGYSSLSYLQQLPFDLIKIDKSFVDLIGSGDNSEMICRTIIKMAHEMGKMAIAEGVETEEQVEFLKMNGCDSVQGYFYCRALPPQEFLEFIEKQDFHTQRRKALEII
jgi:diguanylate cyclase (GGDEF)-like protein